MYPQLAPVTALEVWGTAGVGALPATVLRLASFARNGVVSRFGFPREVASERTDSMVIITTLRGFS